MLPRRARVDLGAMAMKGCSAFPKVITGTSSSDCLVSYNQDTHCGVLPRCREAVGVFYSPSRQGNMMKNFASLLASWTFEWKCSLIVCCKLWIFDLCWFGLVWFYGIPTIVGYLRQKPVYTYTYADIYKYEYIYIIYIGFLNTFCR